MSQNEVDDPYPETGTHIIHKIGVALFIPGGKHDLQSGAHVKTGEYKILYVPL